MRFPPDVDFRVRNRLKDDENFVAGDAQHLAQILLNLLTNAAKFTQKGYVEMTCEALPAGTEFKVDVDPKEIAILFKVTDTGIGIAPESLPTLFLPFSQGAQALENGGYGLVLSISKQLA
jgi:signal transduction histidine kinase